MLRLHIIVGSTRQGRAGEPVLDWVTRTALTDGRFDTTILDLREWNLPHFAETFETVGDPANPTYSEPIVRHWNARLSEADAVLMITPEYNRSYSGPLKNALDSVFLSQALRHKPAGFVSYSVSAVGGARAVEQLAMVVRELEMVPLRNTVLIGQVDCAFDERGEPRAPLSSVSLEILLDDLAWWGQLLADARPTQLPDARVRRKQLLDARDC